jgi:hypothetical protein
MKPQTVVVAGPEECSYMGAARRFQQEVALWTGDASCPHLMSSVQPRDLFTVVRHGSELHVVRESSRWLPR